MAALVPQELEVWRTSAAYHKSLKFIEEKLVNRRYLEQSFDMLRAAWHAAVAEQSLVAA